MAIAVAMAELLLAVVVLVAVIMAVVEAVADSLLTMVLAVAVVVGVVAAVADSFATVVVAVPMVVAAVGQLWLWPLSWSASLQRWSLWLGKSRFCIVTR